MSAEAIRVAAVPGDGIGPEVCEAALLVLEAALGGAPRLEASRHEGGAGAFRRLGTALPEETVAACRAADAVLHGAAGLPDVLLPDGTEAGQDFSMRMRGGFDLYANIRPLKLFAGARSPLAGRGAGEIDFVIARENTEGLYAARGGGTLLRGEVSADALVITRKGVERIAETAAALCRARSGAPKDGRRRETIVDNANVIRGYAFFRAVADEVLARYPEIEVEHVIVDAMTVHMLRDPGRFDVILCENFIGDILSDLGAAMVGGMGLAPSAELGDGVGYFQGSHGSAPDIAGRGVANPIATILSAAMLLDWLAERREDPRLSAAGARIRAAVEAVLREGRATTADLGGPAGTQACAEAIAEAL